MVKYAPRCLLILALVVMLGSCSIKVTYSFLDNLMNWQIGRYVTLKGEQKDLASATFKDFHRWHRETQLTLYADYLESIKLTLLEGDVSADYLHEESNKLQLLIDKSVEQLLPGLTDIASSLTDAQIDEVRKNLKKERDEYKRDYVDDEDEKIQKRRIRDVTRYMGQFFGRFSESQKKRMLDWETNLHPYEELMLAQQEEWETGFVDAMQYRDNKPELQNRLHKLMFYRTDDWDTELQAQLDINQQATFIMLADLFNSQTPKQKKKMRNKFDQYIRDFRSLAGQKETF